jgi:ligand-binding sensor domain-containing protein/two-component sensor histidine kinase
MLLLLCGAVHGERLPLKSYTVADGLAHNEINKIVRDSRGFLWFCTGEGLSRFDGYEFRNFGPDEGLPGRSVNDFLETRSGELWLATNDGLVRFDPKGKSGKRVADSNNQNSPEQPMFSVILPAGEDRQSREINVLFEKSDGTIWIGTQKGLFRLERLNGHLELRLIQLIAPASYSAPLIFDIIEDSRGSLWVGTTNGLVRIWSNGSTATYTTKEGLPDDLIQTLLADRQGRLWAGTRSGGIVRFSADETHAPPVIERTYSQRDGLTTNWVFQLFLASDGRFWVATDRGLAEFFPDANESDSKFKTYTQRNGLTYWGVRTLSEDVGRNLWLGSDAGAMKLAHDGFITYGDEDAMLAVFAIFQDRTGKVCFRGRVFGDEHTSFFEGAKADVLHPQTTFYTRYGRFDGQRFSWLKPDILKESQIGWVGEMVTLQTHNGEWWLGTGQGIYRFAPMDFAQLNHAHPLAVYSTKDGLKAQQIFRLFQDTNDRIWASTIQPNGLAYWQPNDQSWHDLTNATHLPAASDDLARSFGEDNAGDVWIGFNTGVARYHSGVLDFFNVSNGLPPGSVMNIYKDREGRLWLTSSRSGLIRVDHPDAYNPTFASYSTAQGLSSNYAEAITEDLNGRIYVSTGRGLDRLDPTTGRFRHFTTADGLAAGPMRIAFRDQQGALWFGAGRGLSRFTPGAEQPSRPPPVEIIGLTIKGEKQNLSALGESAIALRDLTASENQLEINFVGLSFEPGEELSYQYKLGPNQDWSPANQRRSVTLASLAPGHYEFLVRAVNSDGLSSKDPAMITFTIRAPFWQRWWFASIVVVVIGLTVLMFYRYRVAQILKLTNIRTRIASDLHDDIGANLTKISILSEVAQQQPDNSNGERESPLISIARISRESVAAMSDIVWAINPQRDSLNDVVRRMRINLEETCRPNQIEFEFQAPDDRQLKLGIETRRCLYLIFKEALNNAIRHSGCGHIDVALSVEGEVLNLEVNDNGLGFDATAESDGNGIVSMRRRAEALGGKLQIYSSSNHGTDVRLMLPYSKSFSLLGR